MRPLRLTLEGFRSYADAATFQLAGRRLVGIVGPIGSGKSSLLDGIAFALFGKTPKVASGTKSLINQRRELGRVELWFEVDGQVWRTVRALRRNGQSEHALYRHATPDPESERLEEVLKAGPVTERIEALLGLDFAGFSRSVMLAQNQFAAFLTATGGERDKVLRDVFGFGRVPAMEDIAKQRRRDAARDLEELERLRRDIEADRSQLEKATETQQRTEARLAAFRAAEPIVIEAADAMRLLEADEIATRARLADREAVLDQIPQDARVAGTATRGTAAARAIEEAEAEVTVARDAREAAEQALQDLVAGQGGRADLAEFRSRISRVNELLKAVAAASEQIAAATMAAAAAAETGVETAATVESSVVAVAAARRALEAATEKRMAAGEVVSAVHREHMAHAVRADLAPGEPCPVCLQTVDVLPKASAEADVEAAETDLGHAIDTEGVRVAAVEAAVAAASLAEREAALAAERAESATRSVDEATVARDFAQQQHDEAATELAGNLANDDPAVELDARTARLDAAEAAEDTAREKERAAVASVEAARRAAEETDRELRELTNSLAACAARLEAPVPAPMDPGSLPEVAADLTRLAREQSAAADAHLTGIAQERNTVESGRADLLAGLGIDAADNFTPAIREAAAEHAAAGSEVDLLTERVSRVAELEERNADTVAALEVYTRLAEDLVPSRFLNYLLEEERALLGEIGSERFEVLSGGRYRFDRSGDFGVIDLHAADSTRRADSLSGGETFLASLALALALADMVARGGGTLDSFFLDEGFGSLDTEHLDLAMEGIERLVAGSDDRLVVVVSHLPELRQRIEDLIELDRDPITGDTVVVRP